MTVSIFTSKFSNLGIAPLTIYHSVSLQFLWFYRLEFRSKCSGFLKRHLLKIVSLLEGGQKIGKNKHSFRALGAVSGSQGFLRCF